MSVNATYAVAAHTRKVSRMPCTCPTTGTILILHKPLQQRKPPSVVPSQDETTRNARKWQPCQKQSKLRRPQMDNTINPTRKQELKQQRNRILHAQRRRARDNASGRLDHLASEVDRLHNGANMFRAVREMTRKPAS